MSLGSDLVMILFMRRTQEVGDKLIWFWCVVTHSLGKTSVMVYTIVLCLE